VVDALGGHVPAIVTPLAEVLPHAREGKLRILATTARDRSPLAPDIPTFYELGFDKIVVQDWSGFLMPAGTPPDVVARANAAIGEAVESPKVKDAMAKLGMEVGTRTPEAFAATVRESWERYRDIVKEAGLKAD
jgi:tripartite-type tricarboxylate transporter receptor subunit TctC